MYKHNALGYWSGLALCLTKVRSKRARCPATALIIRIFFMLGSNKDIYNILDEFQFRPDPTLTTELSALECLKNQYLVLRPL